MTTKPRFTKEEKEQLIANLDIEVAHRTRDLQASLAHALDMFQQHQENLIARVPRVIRDITLAEFAKYNGNLQECVKGLQRELLGAQAGMIDQSMRKRKWVESQEMESEKAAATAEGTRGAKTARTIAATPKKKPAWGASAAPGTGQKARLPAAKTPAKSRTLQRIASGAVSPSPQKGLVKPSLLPRTPSRLASPSKLPSPSKAGHPRNPTRVPSASTFAPVLPSAAAHPRWPRKDERVLSVNGSPLANPNQLDLANWFRTVAHAEDDDEAPRKGAARTLKKSRSIVIRSASHQSLQSSGAGGSHSRSTSQASTLVNSQSDTRASTQSALKHEPDFADARNGAAALISVQTKDGVVLELDPLHTTPEELDMLEGIPDSAKKQAKADMLRLMQSAVERWKIA